MNDPEQRDIPCYPRQVDAKPYGFRFFSLSSRLQTHQARPTRHQAQRTASSQQLHSVHDIKIQTHGNRGPRREWFFPTLVR